MSVLPMRWSGRVGSSKRSRAAFSALGICLGGFLAGLVGILLLRAVLLQGVTETDAFRVVAGNLIQVGFAAFGLGYLAWRGGYDRFAKVRVPTPSDVGWIVAATVAIVAGGAVFTPALSLLGLPEPMPGGGGESLDLASRPGLWPVAFVGLYLFAAPAEELVYRGLLQGRLRPAFDRSGVVLLGGLLFGVLHLIVGLVTPAVSFAGSLHWGISAVLPGLVWGYAYERTENLLVTSTSHAMTWTVPFHALLPFL